MFISPNTACDVAAGCPFRANGLQRSYAQRGGRFNHSRTRSLENHASLTALMYNLINQRITEWPGLEGTSRIMKLQPPRHRQNHQPPHLILDQAAQGPIQPGLEHLQGWTGHPQPLWAACSSTSALIVKSFSLILNQNLFSFNLKPFPLVLLLSPLSKSCLPSCL